MTEAPEWIQVDLYGVLPFYRRRCACQVHLVTPVFPIGRCGCCGVRPE